MSNFNQQYKNPRLGFGNVEESRNLRAYNHDISRRNTRTAVFNKNRKLQDISSPSNISPGNNNVPEKFATDFYQDSFNFVLLNGIMSRLYIENM